jgi:hypothetical protein
MTRGHALCSSLPKYKMAAPYKSTEYKDSMQIHFGAEDNEKEQRNFGTYLYLHSSIAYAGNLK